MPLPTWGNLVDNFCSTKKGANPNYEDFSVRRYNFSATTDSSSCRLIFLRGVLQDDLNKTLRRQGRFIWCRNLRYEGRNSEGFRSMSFTVDKGRKRFCVGENNILCLPSNTCVNNSRYFRSKQKVFTPFSSVFSYANSLAIMARNSDLSRDQLVLQIEKDNPYKPGTLVSPRLGYFHPDINPDKLNKKIHSDREHPCGLILGPSTEDSNYVDKEFYRVRFGDTTYEKIHPVQLEIINEI